MTKHSQNKANRELVAIVSRGSLLTFYTDTPISNESFKRAYLKRHIEYHNCFCDFRTVYSCVIDTNQGTHIVAAKSQHFNAVQDLIESLNQLVKDGDLNQFWQKQIDKCDKYWAEYYQ